MRITWETKYLGKFQVIKPDEEVMEFCESLIKLGFTPEVTQE